MKRSRVSVAWKSSKMTCVDNIPQEKDTAMKKTTVTVKPHSYQPKKAELEADVSIDATPEELARAIMQPVIVQEAEDEEG